MLDCLLTGTNLEDEDVLAKNVMDINGRTVSFFTVCLSQDNLYGLLTNVHATHDQSSFDIIAWLACVPVL